MKALQYGRQASDFTESPKAEYFSVYIENLTEFGHSGIFVYRKENK